MAKGENGSNVPQKVGSEITSSNAQNDKRCMRQDDSQGQDPNKILLGPTQNTGADSLGATSCAPSQMPRAPGPGGYKVTGIGGGAGGGALTVLLPVPPKPEGSGIPRDLMSTALEICYHVFNILSGPTGDTGSS